MKLEVFTAKCPRCRGKGYVNRPCARSLDSVTHSENASRNVIEEKAGVTK
jgi:hypothetical protein